MAAIDKPASIAADCVTPEQVAEAKAWVREIRIVVLAAGVPLLLMAGIVAAVWLKRPNAEPVPTPTALARQLLVEPLPAGAVAEPFGDAQIVHFSGKTFVRRGDFIVEIYAREAEPNADTGPGEVSR